MVKIVIWIRFIVFCVLVINAFQANAESLLMVRSSQAFPETMLSLQEAIKEQGYTVTRVQRIDEGLTKLGYDTDKYRVVFFGKKDEIHNLAKRHAELIPYLPLNFTIFAEEDETIISAMNPTTLMPYFPATELGPVFAQWEKDMRAILEELSGQ